MGWDFSIDWREEIPSLATAFAATATWAAYYYLGGDEHERHLHNVRLGFAAAHAFPLALAALAALVVLCTRDTTRVKLPAAHKKKQATTTARAHDLNVLLWFCLTSVGFGAVAWYLHGQLDNSFVPLVWKGVTAVFSVRDVEVFEVHLLRRRPDEPLGANKHLRRPYHVPGFFDWLTDMLKEFKQAKKELMGSGKKGGRRKRR